MNRNYYPAIDWWKESLEDEFQLLINPLLDDLDRKIKLIDLSQYLEGSLPFISQVYTDGISILGTGTVDDPLVSVGASGDTNFANTDLTFEGSRFHEGDANDLYFHGFERFQIYTQNDVALRKGTDLTFWDNDDLNYITFSLQSPLPTSTTYYLPSSDGSDGQVLTTNGFGELTWEDVSGGGGSITDVTATFPITSSGGTTPNISTSMATNKLIGRTTSGSGAMEEITLGAGLSFSGSNLNVGNIDLSLISVTSTNSREDNWSPTGWTSGVVKVIDFTPNNSNNIISLGGLSNPSVGKIVTIVNSSTNNLIIIEHEATTSSADNRFKLAQKSPYFLMPEREITFLYTGTRWAQFNTHPNQGGFDFYDDFENLSTTAGSQATKMFWGTFSGSGAGLVSGSDTLDIWGAMKLTAGTSATGYLYASVDYRRFGGGNIFGVNGAFPQLWVSKVKIDTLPTALQDWNFNAGLNASSSTVATNGQTGLMWEMPTFASGGVTPAFWNIRITNASNALTLLTPTTVPITNNTYIYLGIFITGTNGGDAIFFYSLDGVTYNFIYRFTKVSGNYGGIPFYRLAGTVGNLNTRSASVDWCGESFNSKR